MWRAVHDFTHLTRRHVLHVIVHHPCFYVQHRTPAGTGLAQLVFWAKHGGQRCNFGLAIQIPQTHLGQTRGQFFQNFNGHDRSTVIAFRQMRELVGVKQGGTQERNPDRGRGKEAGDFVFLNECQQIVGHRFRGDYIAAAYVNGRAKKDIELRTVVKRQGMQGQIVFCNFSIDHATHVLPKHRVVGQHGPFGHGLCATGVHNLGQVLAGQTRFGQGMGTSRQFMEVVHARYRLAGIF